MGVTILHIEDDEWFADMLQLYLKKNNVNIEFICDNAEDAIKVLKERTFDFILVDMQLNKNIYGGIEVTKAISEYTDAYILILSGSYLSNELVFEAYEAGACGFEIKDRYENIPNVLIDIIANKYPPLLYLQQVKLNKLKNNEQKIVENIKQNLNKSQIAEVNNKSYQATRKQIQRIKNKIGATWRYLFK